MAILPRDVQLALEKQAPKQLRRPFEKEFKSNLKP